MSARNERRYYEVTDKKFRITLFLKKNKLLERLVLQSFNLLCYLIRKFYSSGTNENKGVVIIALHRLGDTVFCMPAIRQIIREYSDEKITIVCFPETRPILELEFKKHNIVTIDKNSTWFNRRFARKESRNKINVLKPKIIFDLTGIPLSASLVYSVRSDCKVGMNIPALKNLYHHFTYIREKPHLMDRYIEVVNLIVPLPDGNEFVSFPPMKKADGDIIIHPFAIRKAKEWNLNNFIILARKLSEDFNVKIVAPPEFIDQEIVTEINLSGLKYIETKSVTELISVLRDCSVMIGNDSGPVYIAAVLGKPTITIYGPTNPSHSFPRGGTHKFIRHKLKCSPTYNQYCYTLAGMFCPSQECLEAIDVTTVYSEVVAFLKQINITPKPQIHNIIN
ncbi:MAG: hypothetical protein Kow0098_16990 [Ignavibacteriaceae bacterium]